MEMISCRRQTLHRLTKFTKKFNSDVVTFYLISTTKSTSIGKFLHNLRRKKKRGRFLLFRIGCFDASNLCQSGALIERYIIKGILIFRTWQRFGSGGKEVEVVDVDSLSPCDKKI